MTWERNGAPTVPQYLRGPDLIERHVANRISFSASLPNLLTARGKEIETRSLRREDAASKIPGLARPNTAGFGNENAYWSTQLLMVQTRTLSACKTSKP